MLLKIRHGLLEISNQPAIRKSAIIINNDIIITSACILQPYLHDSGQQASKDDIDIGSGILTQLQQSQLINAQEAKTKEARFLKSLQCRVMFDNRRHKPLVDPQQPNILSCFPARILYLFSTGEIARHLHTFLSAATSTEHGDYNAVLLSSFLVLSISGRQEKEAFERFLLHIGNYLRYLHPMRTLDDVLTICTPFGMEHFYKTISIGKVSNVMGRDACLFVLSNVLPLGCEGAAVFNNKLRLIGIIICTTFTFQLENVNLSLAGNFDVILREFMRQMGVKITSFTVPREPSNFSWESAMVVIEAAGKQGTGTFVRVQNKKFILTCAHVVSSSDAKVFCRSIDGEFESHVLWQNPHYNQPFDVALLAVPDKVPGRYCARLSTVKPHVGQTVYNAGFPYYVNFNLKYDFNPSIFQGRIIKCASGAILSDGCVQAGQSGGPMFDQQGCILGICVSNIKLDETVYPNVNTAVPIFNIRKVLEDYVKTNDINILNNLVANEQTQKFWALEQPYVLSKL